jgi:Kelch motif
MASLRAGLIAVALLTAPVAAACDHRVPAPSGATSGPAATGGWRSLPPAPSARTEVAAAAVGSRILVIGGYRADGATVATVDVFDTAGRRWDSGPALPLPLNHAMAASVAGTAWIFGGYLADNSVSAAAFRLDGGRWRRMADLPEGRAAGTAVPVGTRVYLAGGIRPGGGLADRMLVYDTSTDRWSSTTGPPTRREHLGGAGSRGRVYTVGGRTAAGNLGAFEVYDPATGQWAALPQLPTRRGGLGAAAACDGRIIAVGGEGAATFPQVEAYDPDARTWRSLPPLPTPRHGLGVLVVGTTLYTLAGGPQPGLHVTDTVEAMDLPPGSPCVTAS